MSAICEDGVLIGRLQEGEVAALGELYDKYRLQIFHTALAITRDRQVAEDILQECFLKVHAHAERLDRSMPLGPWLHRVAVNFSYMWVTRHAKRWTSIENLLDRLVSSARNTPEQQAEAQDLQKRVQQAIESLPFNQRVVVVLYYLSDLNLKEIAYTLDCPVGTVKSRLHYGREALRRQLSSTAKSPTAPSQGVAYDFT